MDGAPRWAPVGLVLHSLPPLPQPQAQPHLPCPLPSATRLQQSPVSSMSHGMNQENSSQTLLITGFQRKIPSWPEERRTSEAVVEPHLNHFCSLLFSHQTEGNTSLQLQQFHSSIVFTPVKLPVLGVSHVALSLPESMPKQTLGSQTR